MDTIKATVETLEEKRFIRIDTGDAEIRIPMSEEKPTQVKSAFNKLITRIKTGEFQIELEDLGDDLFCEVAKEYIAQLNREIQEVFSEMQEYGLVQQ